jgi:hypothetical protein
MVDNTCEACGTQFRTYPSQARRFCGKACGYASRRKVDITSKYRMVYAPGHPLTVSNPYIPEHRMLLWERIGPGAHPCHHCDKSVTWLPGEKTKRGALVVDHLDRDSHNNAPENLAPSCQSCNARNQQAGVTSSEPHRARPDGSRVRGQERSCEHCGGPFVAWPDKLPNKGRFCSRSCARRAPRTRATG